MRVAEEQMCFWMLKSSLVRRAWIIRAEFGGPAAEQYSGFHFVGPNQLTMNLIFLLNFF